MRALFLLLFLAGCGSGEEPNKAVVDNNNHGYGYDYDIASANGLKLRGSFDVSYFDTAFTETEACSGLNASPPFVILVAHDSLGPPVIGEYINHPSLVLIDVSYPFEYVVKHEYIHYLLDVNTGDSDHNHKSPLFAFCS